VVRGVSLADHGRDQHQQGGRHEDCQKFREHRHAPEHAYLEGSTKAALRTNCPHGHRGRWQPRGPRHLVRDQAEPPGGRGTVMPLGPLDRASPGRLHRINRATTSPKSHFANWLELKELTELYERRCAVECLIMEHDRTDKDTQLL
jgi:hypothetical protein